ncbi:MAG: AAA family ATPase [Nitrosotalea sp.]
MPLTDQTDDWKLDVLRSFSPRPLMSLEDDRNYFTKYEEIEKIIRAVEIGENVLIIGDRGSGKTSLLNHMLYHYFNTKATEQVIPVRFSALSIEELNQKNLVRSLIRNIVDSIFKIKSTSERIKVILNKMIDSSPTTLPDLAKLDNMLQTNTDTARDDFEALTERLSELVLSIRKKEINFFVMIDDLDKFPADKVWHTFRSIRDILWELHFSLIITALPDQVSEITKPPLDQFFPYWIKIPSFDMEYTKSLIEKRFNKSQVTISNDALEAIVNRTKGNPRSIIAIMKNVIESNDFSSQITLDNINNLGLPYSIRLSDIQRAVINYLAENPNTSASTKNFIARIGVTRSRLSQILNDLRKDDLIGSKKVGRSTYYFITRKGIEVRTKK